MSARDIEIAVPDLAVKAAASVVWGYGLGWDLAKTEQWYKRLSS